ncbi:MAG: DUF58 domain-containing protein [Oscillospiraceae bacterium]|nr:DUF58 domain-containing protein [Oscillospiraceae bacterium]
MIIFITFGVILMVIFIQRFIYIKFAFKNLRFDYYFSQTEVKENDIFYITEIIENKKYLPLPAVSTILEIGAGLAFANGEEEIIEQKSVYCFYTVGMYKKITRTWRVKAIMRGRFNMSSITVHVRDIFGLVKISKDFECDTSVLILPAAYDINKRINSLNLTGGYKTVTAGYFSNPFEILKIMPYTYNEPLNKINWKASAKNQVLMVNYEQPAISEKITVILDASEKYYLEKNIKICATLKKLLTEENEINFISNGIMPENYFNPLLKFNKKNNINNFENTENINLIETHGFNLDVHEKNFKRLLSEIWGNYSTDKDLIIPAEDLAEQARKNIFGDSVLLVKGGRIYDYETDQTIFL